MLKVLIRREHCQFMAHTELGEQGIYRSRLYTLSTTAIPQIRCIDMIVPVRDKQWQR